MRAARVNLVVLFAALWSVVLAIPTVVGGQPLPPEPTVGGSAVPVGSAVPTTLPSAVPVGEIRGVINPIVVRYVERVIQDAEERQAPLVVFTMDTPGGLESSMREIVQHILRSRVPVAIYVWPNGARAGSAGVFIMYAGHVAAMAPASNIGSAHPVGIGDGGQDSESTTMIEKVTNDAVALIRSLAQTRGRNVEWAEQAVRTSANLPATEALEMNVIDLIAEDVPALLRAIDGRTVRVGTQETRLATRGLSTEPAPMTLVERFFHAITDPTIAYLLLSIGGLALVYELANPGAIFPGVVGGIALLIGLFSLGTLEINAAAAGFILFGIVLLIADLLVAGTGVLTVGSVVSFALGSLLLVTSSRGQPFLQVSIPTIVLTTILFSAFAGLLAWLSIRTVRRPATSGTAALIDRIGVTQTEVGEEGMVFIDGELWKASARDPRHPIAANHRVRIVAADGLRVTVESA
jgi:membrane-bound serine protease (ClpP class)